MLIVFSIIMVTAIISHINMASGSTMASTAMVITNFYYNIKSSVVRQISLYNGNNGMCKHKTVATGGIMKQVTC